MLPEGSLGPTPGWGSARESRETLDEQRAEFALWCFARAPLFFGGNLTRLNALSRSLLTSRTLLAIDQHATSSRPIPAHRLGPAYRNLSIWSATVAQAASGGDSQYLALFNLSDSQATVNLTWKQLGFNGSEHRSRNLWNNTVFTSASRIGLSLPPHGSAVLEVY